MPSNGGSVTGGTTGYTYQLWTLDFPQVTYYDTLDRLSTSTALTTLSNSDSGHVYTRTGSTLETVAPSSSLEGCVTSSGSATTTLAVSGLSSQLNGDMVLCGCIDDFNTYTSLYFYLTANTYIYATSTSNGVLSAFIVVNGTVTSLGTTTITTSSFPSVALRLKWSTTGSTTTISAGYAVARTSVNYGACDVLPTIASAGTLTSLATITPQISMDYNTLSAVWGGIKPTSGTTFAIAAQINTPLPLTSAAGTAQGNGTISGAATVTFPTGTAQGNGTLIGSAVQSIPLFGTVQGSGTSTATALVGTFIAAVASGSGSLTGSARGYLGSSYPWQYVKTQLVKVYNPQGIFVDVWRDAPLLDGFKEAIQSSTTPLRVKLPRRFDRFDEVGTTGALGSIGQGNVVQWWLYGPGLPATGFLRYQGIIDAYEPTIDANGEEYVTVTVTPKGSAVGDNSLIGVANFGTPGKPSTYIDPVHMFDHWFGTPDPATGLPYPYPLGRDATNPTVSGYATQYTFINQTMKDIWDTILLLLPPNWFWRVNVNGDVTLNQSPITAQHTFILGRHCVSLGYTKDWTQLKNNILVQGGNDPNTGLPITAIKVGSDISIYGNRSLLLNESRITDQNTANVFAQALLAVHDTVQYRATMRIFDYRGDAQVGLGADIESIQVGQTCTVIAPQFNVTPPTPPSYWDQMVYDQAYWDSDPAYIVGGTSLWDQMLWNQGYFDFSPGNALGQISQIIAIDYHWDYVDLTLAALRPSQDVALARMQARLQSALLTGTANSPALWG